MGFSLKSVGNLVGKAVGAAGGAFFGGPAGAVLGFNGADSFFGGPTGAVLGFNGADAVLGAVGLGSDQLAAEQQWKYQKKASDYAFNRNLQMWNLANAYNDPAAQMERLQRAGLNPNLVYNGNVTGNTSGSAPTYERPGGSYVDRSTQRQQLAMALIDHQQRITNQAIENDLARQRLVLQERDADRSDRLADAQIDAYKMNFGLTSENNRINSQLREDTLSWRKYNDDHRLWERRREQLPWYFKDDPVKVEKVLGREPIYMDYL